MNLLPTPCFAWLSLDESDNDPTRFLAYLIAALQTVEADIGKGALSALAAPQPQPLPVEDILIALINEVTALPYRAILVLDDYHLIQAQSIHEAMAFLLDHLPPPAVGGLHLVIATREDPLLPLARLRARGQLTELRAADLRFSSSEAAEFLNQVMGLDLAVEDVAALERRTEGWIAGLQLASLAAQGPARQGRQDVTGFVQSFTGSHRFVLDYLLEEVLEQQSESVQRFLLYTSVLDRLTGSLCDAVRFGSAKREQLGDAKSPSSAQSTAGQGNSQATLPEQDVAMRSVAAIALGNAYGFRGEMAAAYRARPAAVEASKSGGNTYFTIVAHLEVAITLREQGRLRRTLEICEEQTQLADTSGLSRAPVAGCLLAIWGEVLAEQGDLEGANRQVKRGVERTEGRDLAMRGWSYLCLMRVLFSSGDVTAAQALVQKVEHTAREADVPPWITNQMAAWQARLWLAQDKLEAAAQWARERALVAGEDHKPAYEMDYFTLIEYTALARILIAQERLGETTRLLQQLLEVAEAGDRTTRVIEILNLQALALHAWADTPRAIDALERALILAEPEGFIRIFVDEGPPMARLLYKAVARGIAGHGPVAQYARRLLAAFPIAEPGQTDSVKARAFDSELVEPLSERELEVLALIAEGLTNLEVASRLFLSLNTVKAHTRNIYGKLGAHSRTQAVARARTLGTLFSA